VLPSLPGYGFSGEPAELGWNVGRVAQAWAELMRRLGYTRYVAQGGDVGAAVTDTMGRQAPAGLLGIHMNLLVTVLAGPPQAESEQERAAVAQLATFRESGFGYFLEMATRPQTIGYALLDSPVALVPGCSTTTRTATTRSPARSSTAIPWAISPGTTSSTTSPCTG
jgi:pimeloyl-ACP methyl ester carboxylesterase